MNLKKINELIGEFKVVLKEKSSADDLLLYQLTENWQKSWDIDVLDLYQVYNNSLENWHTRRLWVGENYEPKKMMLEFLSTDREFVREMFRDLFNNEKEVMGRMDRFVFHCDSLLESYKEKNRSSIQNRHYHDDGYKILSLYLSLEYPENFSFFYRDGFEKFLSIVQAQFVSGINDIQRYFKVSKIVFNLMQKDAELMNTHFDRLDETCYQKPSMNLFFEMVNRL